ncbi:glycoside hydrolase [Serendipita vermifera]|nr:glycoside hydrolase [Serendipita vermifera]
MRSDRHWPLVFLLSCLAFSVFGDDKNGILNTAKYASQPVRISHMFDNVATTDFDGRGHYYPINILPKGTLKSENVNFTLPVWEMGLPDNVLSNSQVIDVHIGLAREFHLLYAGDWIDGETAAKFEFIFADGSTQSVDCSVKNWWTLHWLNSGPIKLPYHEGPKGTNYNVTQIHHWSTPIHSYSHLRHIRLPETRDFNRLHIFAISLVPAYAPVLGSTSSDSQGSSQNVDHYTPSLTVKNLRLTTRHVEDGPQQGDRVVEVTLSNMLAYSRDTNLLEGGFITGRYSIHITGPGVVTTLPGKITRLMPGDDARLDVGVTISQSTSKSLASIPVHVEIRREKDPLVIRSEEWKMDILPEEYEATSESLARHETPSWWRNSKFGIFIHWGIYSVPGWVPKGYYEEWYDWWIHNPAQPTNILWNHHRKVYGEDVVYDDFIKDFSGAKFNASQWVDLFADAGAKYFVLVTKHHDGFALFDTANSTHRSSVHLGPHRDFLDELMSAAKERHPELRRGTYYSMPEWFNPSFAPYGFGNWPGGLAKHAYKSRKMEEYTGHLEGKDYLQDIQLKHMETLAEKYGTDIMWCDIGGPNRTFEFAAKWYNDARQAGRQVTMNNRCGAAPDFDTPEYARFSSVQTRSWETNEGIDPWSYGYNRLTKDDEYRSTTNIIHSLVDIVSKNGNYLLNLGPTGEGEIISAMVERVKEVGKWLEHSGKCIYNTTYSFPGAEENNLRFTTTRNTFCIIALSRPEACMPSSKLASDWLLPMTGASDLNQMPQHIFHQNDIQKYELLTVKRALPILPGDEVVLLGGTGKPLHWRRVEGRLEILVPSDELERVQYAWAFEIRFRAEETPF